MDELTIDLFDTGMSALHRAGLGGLACTLNWIDQDRGLTSRPPGSWEFDDRRVTLHWDGGATGAEAFFQALYGLAFRLEDGLIDLPGSYWPGDLNPVVQAELQRGYLATILQFTKKNVQQVPSKRPRAKTYEIDGQTLTVQYPELIRYVHQSAWKSLVSRRALRARVAVDSTIAPGFAQRHVIHSSTYIELAPNLAVASHFALVGTISFVLDRDSGVLVIPDVQDLGDFVRRRQLLNPRDAKGCQVNSPADAALQAEVRLRAIGAGSKLKVDRCQAVLFASQPWNDTQKTRATVLDVAPEGRELDLFEEAMGIEELKPRLVLARPEKKGEESRPFWSKGVVRPLIAENLARYQPWYKDFRGLIVSADGRTDEDRVRQLGYETKGLQAMIEKTPWQDRGEAIFVESVHEAMRSRFAAIGEEADDPVTFGNRVDRQRQRWRLKLAGAKTPDDLRAALTDLWSRSAYNPALQDGWRAILPMFCGDDRWQLIRDLALLALSSYKRAERPENQARTEGEEGPTPVA